MTDHNSSSSQSSRSRAGRGSGGDNLGFRLPLWVKAALIILLISLSSIGYLKSSFFHKGDNSKANSEELDQRKDEKRKKIPDFEMLSYEGKPTKFSEFKGNVIILSFWAGWCTPCIVELPELDEVAKRYADRGLKIIPINVDREDSERAAAKTFWEKNKYGFATYYDTSGELARKFNVENLPSNFVIDRNGNEAFSSFGASNWSGEEAREYLEELLDEK